MNIIITITAIAVALLIIFWVLRVSKKKELNEIHALLWLLGSVGLIILGIFPEIIMWFSELLGVYWPPSLLIFFLLVLAFLLLFSHSKTVSILTNQITELTMQVSLLKHDNDELRKTINKTNKGNTDESNSLQ